MTIAPGTYSVVVGAGGAAATVGNPTTMVGVLVTGGGGGKGSGSFAGSSGTPQTTAGGGSGGDGVGDSANGGGGGAGGAGASAVIVAGVSATAGVGGIGFVSDISGVPDTYAGGGGGDATGTNGFPALGGGGGGGPGAGGGGNATGPGGGGGGGHLGAGADGIAQVQYPQGTVVATGGTITTFTKTTTEQVTTYVSQSVYPGKTNKDLVWMVNDYRRDQILIGIPYCNATTGAGQGNDTVIIKYQLPNDEDRSGGFTRQVCPGVIYTAATYLRAYGQGPESRFLANGTTAQIGRYAYDEDGSAIMPSVLPTWEVGPYAPFGPDGVGVVRRLYFVLSWIFGITFPLVFRITIQIDDVTSDQITLNIGYFPLTGASEGDLWLDISQTNRSTGNATAGTGIAATGGYLLNTFHDGAWQLVPGHGGKGQRITIQIPVTRRPGTRYTVAFAALAATARFEMEGVGFDAGSGELSE